MRVELIDGHRSVQRELQPNLSHIAAEVALQAQAARKARGARSGGRVGGAWRRRREACDYVSQKEEE